MNDSSKKIRIGTRGSPLALTQTRMVRDALVRAVPGIEVEQVVIKTTGDWRPEQGEVRLEAAAGGKASFAKEIEEALLAGEIDAAVHSMKDMETHLPAGLALPVMLPREDARDALLLSDDLRTSLRAQRSNPAPLTSQEIDCRVGSDDPPRNDDCLDFLPEGARVGTASVRRQAFLLRARPDLKIVPLRGNVQTRIDKVRSGQVDASFLAMAGLNRLGLEGEADLILEVEGFLPAAGQGAVGVEILSSNKSILANFSQLNCRETFLCVSAERAALAALDGSCHTPIGAHAVLTGGEMRLRVIVAALDGSAVYEEQASQNVQDVENAVEFGTALGEKLKTRLPEGLLAQRADS